MIQTDFTFTEQPERKKNARRRRRWWILNVFFSPLVWVNSSDRSSIFFDRSPKILLQTIFCSFFNIYKIHTKNNDNFFRLFSALNRVWISQNHHLSMTLVRTLSVFTSQLLSIVFCYFSRPLCRFNWSMNQSESEVIAIINWASKLSLEVRKKEINHKLNKNLIMN